MQVRVVYNKSVYIVLLVFGATVTCVSSLLCAGMNLVTMFFNVKKSITWCTSRLLFPSYTTYYIYQYMVKNIQYLYACLRHSNLSKEAPSIFPCSALPCFCSSLLHSLLFERSRGQAHCTRGGRCHTFLSSSSCYVFF